MGEDSEGFARIHETLGEDLQGFGKDLQGFMRLWESKDLQDFDLQGFAILWERIWDLRLWQRICKDLQDFGRGFAMIQETLGEDLQEFGIGFARIQETL